MQRREFLRVAATAPIALSLALGKTGSIQAQERRTHNALIIIFLSGGGPQKEMWDPDPPHVPLELRGPMGNIQTNTPGVHFGECWPELAARTHKFALIRAVDAGTVSHTPAMTNAVMHGSQTISEIIGDKAANGGVPYGFLNPGSTWDGTQVSFRQSFAFAPLWDTAAGRFVPPVMPENPRLAERRRLLEMIETPMEGPMAARMDRFRQTAFDLLMGGGRFFNALDLPARDRERFGNSLAGDMVLLSKRLVEHGAGAVTCYHEPESQAWDMHGNLVNKMRQMGPEMDKAIATLVDEVHRRSVNATLVVMGEFNRTYRWNGSGRDHQQLGNAVILAGRGMRGGVVHGRTDRFGAPIADGSDQRTTLQNTILAACGEELPSDAPRIREVLV